MEFTKKVAEYITGENFNNFPQEVIERGKMCFLDTIGVGYYGSGFEASQIAADVIGAYGGVAESLVFGSDKKLPSILAARINGVSCHVADYDDGNPEYKGHPSCVNVPAVLAYAESAGASGKEVLEGFLTGVEVGCKLGKVMGWPHYDHGWHGTSTNGTIAAAAAICKMKKLNIEQTINAIGIAASSASGVRQNFGTYTKCYHAGHAASNGILAASLAEKGYTASADSIEGSNGYIKVLNGEANLEYLDMLGHDYTIMNGSFKLYPSCAGTHAAVEAVMALRDEYTIDPEKVEAVDCLSRPMTEGLLVYTDPENEFEAKFSLQYCVASALVAGRLYLQDFSPEAIRRPEVRALFPKIRLLTDAKFEPACIEKNLLAPAEVTITYDGGKKVSTMLWEPKGGPENPVSWDDLAEKFRGCTADILSPIKTGELIDAIASMETINNINQLTGIMKV